LAGKKYNLGRLTTGRPSFLGDESQVVFEMPDVLIEHLAQAHGIWLGVDSGTLPSLLWHPFSPFA
jgi:hypothetical protein